MKLQLHNFCQLLALPTYVYIRTYSYQCFHVHMNIQIMPGKFIIIYILQSNPHNPVWVRAIDLQYVDMYYTCALMLLYSSEGQRQPTAVLP